MDIAGLQLINFFSHRNTNISLSGGLVGVFGPNGAGKSSLIADAVTWCLWGKARVGGAGDAMISTGQSFCEVAVTFRVNGQPWKVTRARVRDSKTALDLSSWKQDRWTDLTGPTLKDTQQAIVGLLGMSYEVFKNSSYIEQGQANSFSNLTPAEAANVILDILQLNRYKQYRKLATEKVSNLSVTINRLLLDINSLTAQLETYKNSGQLHQSKLESQQVVQAQYDTSLYNFTEAESQSRDILETLSKLTSVNMTYDATFSSLATQLAKVEGQLHVLEDEDGAQCPLCQTILEKNFLSGLRETLKLSVKTLKAEQQALHFSLVKNASKISEEENRLRQLRVETKRTDVKNLEKQLAVLDAEIQASSGAIIHADTLTS